MNGTESSHDDDNEVFISEANCNHDENNETTSTGSLWQPSGSYVKDFLFFSGPGWFVSIAYVDPGNYQADILAGATSQYNLLFALWWTSILSIFVQILCVRLSFYGKLTLSQAQALNSSKKSRYFHWAIAELSTCITDLPGVIGFAIALNYFFGWPYYAGVCASLFTTLLFLATLNFSGGMRVLEMAVAIFVAILSVALFVEMDFVNPDVPQLLKGWGYGFVDANNSDIFSIAGILGSVVMPHNLYLHTAAVQTKSKQINQSPDVIQSAVKYCSWEPVAPIIISFFVNMAVISIAAESVYGQSDEPDKVGISDFCSYFQSLKGGCLLWAIALLAAGQSGAITTTYTGQYVMDGFLNLQIPIALRSIVTRLAAILPGVIVSVLFPDRLNSLVNVVNALLGILLPFAFTPLVKFNCSESIMGKHASKGVEKYILYSFAIAVWAINATTISATGGGFFGDFLPSMDMSLAKVLLIFLQVVLQLCYAYWNLATLFRRDESSKNIMEQHRNDVHDHIERLNDIEMT